MNVIARNMIRWRETQRQREAAVFAAIFATLFFGITALLLIL